MNEYIREKICKEYREKYSEKTNKTICALLNSGGGHYSLFIDIEIVANQWKMETIDQASPFYDKKIMKKKDWTDLVIDGFCEAIHNDLIQDELLKKLWVSSILKDKDDSVNRIDYIVKNVLFSCLRFVGYDVEGMTLVVKLYVEKPVYSGVFFCLKKRNKRFGFDDNRSGQKPAQEYLYDYYFFVGDKIVKTDQTHLRYFEVLTRNPDLPIIKEYEPTNYISKKEFIIIRNNNNVVFKVIGELKNGNALYKYMDLESALLCLERRVKGGKVEKSPNLRFVEPTSWDDQYEGRFYNACYKNDNKYGDNVDVEPEETPFLYACCFSSNRENEAAWVLYPHNRTGLASRCVEFKLNRLKLREQLVYNLKNCSVYIGPVQYLNKEKIDHIHEKQIGKNNQPNEDYDKYFRPFTIESYLNLLLMKRSVFEHEKEVRIFIVPNDEVRNEKTRRGQDGKFPENVKPKTKYVDIDWVEVIEEVRVDKKNCTDYEVSLLQNKINELVRIKKKRDGLKNDEYKDLLSKLIIKDSNPYKDDSLAQGPITIVTNQ